LSRRLLERMFEEPLNVIITGVGGQGNVLASKILATVAVESGFYASVGETYGAAQRGGAVMSHVRISKDGQYGPLTPQGKGDIILGFEPVECLRTIGSFGNKKTRIIVNPRPIYPIDVLSGATEYPHVDSVLQAIRELVSSVYVVEATELAKEVGAPIIQNMAMLGCLAGAGLTPFEYEAFREATSEEFSEKGRARNLRALELGYERIKTLKPL